MNPAPLNKKLAIFQASEWKTKLGLNTEIESMEFKVLLKRRHAGEYQLARNAWDADYDDASSFLALVRCGSDQNDDGNCNPQADALIRQAAASPDPATRQKLQSQAVALAMADYPVIPLMQSTRPRLVKAYVGGYSYSPQDHYDSKNFYIVRH
jgi:oligopeptide transport system substrate-binding protein